MDPVQFLKCILFFSLDRIIIYWNELYDLHKLVGLPVWFVGPISSIYDLCDLVGTLVPEVFLFFSDERAAKRLARVAKRRERKTSGYLGLESHFHADARVRI